MPQSIEEIDLIKRQIEAKYIPIIKKIFRHIAEDAKALYLRDKKIPIEQLVKNYSPEFLKVIRDAQRETIKVFGFDIREMAESKGYSFKSAKFRALIDYHIETKDIDFILDPAQADKVNNEFALAAALFVANTSEQQVAYIDDTNFKEISDAEKMAVILFFNEQSDLQNQIYSLSEELRDIEFSEMLGVSQSIAAAKKKKIQDKIVETQKKLDELVANKDKIIADNIEKNLLNKAPARSELIAAQNVGMAESWARQKEAELVNENVPEIELKKRWQSILDSRTRSTHIAADGQEVGVNENFIVGGYPAKMPRAENLPIEETANCRCVAIYLNE